MLRWNGWGDDKVNVDLPWGRKQWKQEIKMYIDQWKRAHALPARLTEELYRREPPSIVEFRAFSTFYIRKLLST